MDMKDVMKHLTVGDTVYPICFNLNVMEEIQELYGSLTEWGNVIGAGEEPKIKDLKAGLLAMMNEAIDIENETAEEKRPFLNSKQVGRILSAVGIDEVSKIIQEVTVDSTETGEEPKNE